MTGFLNVAVLILIGPLVLAFILSMAMYNKIINCCLPYH
jgi:hypothetical protein